jgi:hypothetical protein
VEIMVTSRLSIHFTITIIMLSWPTIYLFVACSLWCRLQHVFSSVQVYLQHSLWSWELIDQLFCHFRENMMTSSLMYLILKAWYVWGSPNFVSWLEIWQGRSSIKFLLSMCIMVYKFRLFQMVFNRTVTLKEDAGKVWRKWCKKEVACNYGRQLIFDWQKVPLVLHLQFMFLQLLMWEFSVSLCFLHLFKSNMWNLICK